MIIGFPFLFVSSTKEKRWRAKNRKIKRKYQFKIPPNIWLLKKLNKSQNKNIHQGGFLQKSPKGLYANIGQKKHGPFALMPKDYGPGWKH